MMTLIKLLFISVLTLFCYVMIGFILRKTKLVNEGFAKNFSVYVLYVAQVALLLHGFIIPFDKMVLKNLLILLFFAVAAHIAFYFFAINLYKKAPDATKQVLRFATIFSNAGYMGIPVISDVFGEEYVIYATFYCVAFNVFAFSLGRLIYTGDAKYIKLKNLIINPAVIPISIGFILYCTGATTAIVDSMSRSDFLGQTFSFLYNILTVLKNTVAPASMIIIGVKLAETSFKGLHRDKNVYLFLILRLFLLATLLWIPLRVLYEFSLITYEVMAILVILASTPSAALTTMFAELYDKDSKYAGKLVALSTVLSVLTMPLVALLLKI